MGEYCTSAGMYFQSTKDKWKYSPHECNVPYCMETSLIRDLFYYPRMSKMSHFSPIVVHQSLHLCKLLSVFFTVFFALFIRTNSLISASFSDSSESSSNQSWSDTPGLVLLPTAAIILASCRLWSLRFSLLHMRITTCNTGEYYTVAFGTLIQRTLRV